MGQISAGNEIRGLPIGWMVVLLSVEGLAVDLSLISTWLNVAISAVCHGWGWQ